MTKGTSRVACPLFRNDLSWRAILLSQILHVRIGAQARVISQIPSGMIGIVVDDNVVRVPIPAVDKTPVIGCDAEVETIEPKTAWPTAAESPTMTRSEPSGEAAMRIWLVQMVIRIIASRVVTDPCSAVIDVRGVWMARPVAVVALVVALLRIYLTLMLIALVLAGAGLTLADVTLVLVGAAPVRSWSAFRGGLLVLVPRSLPLIPAILLVLLGKCRYSYHQQCCQS